MQFHVIGIDDSTDPHFVSDIKEVIGRNKVFSGGIRHHEIVASQLPIDHIWINITPPMDTLFEMYRSYDEIVVFASGDPLFYGFVATIQRILPHAEIVTFPFFNSLQVLSHRLVMPYQDMKVVSLTGRPWHKFDEALISAYKTIGILTDNKEHTPAKIAQRMIDYGYTNYSISIGELLGNNEKERVSTLSVEEVANGVFLYPNNMILQGISTRKRFFGIPESEFILLNGREKMITKMPIRLASLSQLDLYERSVFWDIGFCTGSVSIEAKMQFPHLQIVSFEIREEGKQLMKDNSRKFGTPGIEAIIGDFTQIDISTLQRPDAVFIGGHGGKMKQILQKVYNVLNDNGLIVFNSVSQSSYDNFTICAQELGMTIASDTTITTNKHNSISVLKAIKR